MGGLGLERFLFSNFALIQIIQLERGQEAQWETEGAKTGKDHEMGFNLGSPEMHLGLDGEVLPIRILATTMMNNLLVIP